MWPEFPLLPPTIVRNSLWGHRCSLGERRQYIARVGTTGIWPFHVTFLGLQGLLGSDHTFLFHGGVWLCTPNFVVWWFKVHPVHEGQLQLHANLVACGQEFSLWYQPGAGQKLFLKRRLIFCRQWQAFLQTLKVLCCSSHTEVWYCLEEHIYHWHFKPHWICWIIWLNWMRSSHNSLDLLYSHLLLWAPLQTSSFSGHSINELE